MHIIVYIIFICVVLWLIMIQPYNERKERMAKWKGFDFAHRGFHDNEGDAPENSLAAFRLACESGYGIELDIRESADGQIVVCHDDNLLRVAGIDRCISEMTSSEIRQVHLFHSKEGIPTFQEALKVIDGRVPVIIELKTDGQKQIPSFCESAAFFIDSYQGDTCIESFDPRVLYWFRKHHNLTLRGQLSDRFSMANWSHHIGGFFLSCCIFNRFTKPDFIAYNQQHATRLRYQMMKLMGVFGVAWTVRSEEELERAQLYFDLFIFEGFHPQRTAKADRITGGRDMSHIIRKHLMFSGTVQAVGFRYRATYIAQAVGVTGWVKNLYDGRVQMEAQGTPEQLDEMIRRLRRERFIVITSIDEMVIPTEADEYEFKVKY